MGLTNPPVPQSTSSGASSSNRRGPRRVALVVGIAAALVVGTIAALLILPGHLGAASSNSGSPQGTFNSTPIDLLGGNSWVSNSLVYYGSQIEPTTAYPTYLSASASSAFWTLDQPVFEMAPRLHNTTLEHNAGAVLFPESSNGTNEIHAVGVFSPTIHSDGLEAYLMVDPQLNGQSPPPAFAPNPEGSITPTQPCEGAVIFPYSSTPYIAVQWDPSYAVANCSIDQVDDFNLFLVTPAANGSVSASSILGEGPTGGATGALPAFGEQIDYTVSYSPSSNFVTGLITDPSNPSATFYVAANLSAYGFSPSYTVGHEYYMGAGASGNTYSGWGLLYLGFTSSSSGSPFGATEGPLPPSGFANVALARVSDRSR